MGDNKKLTNEEIEKLGYGLCEFGGECENCDKEVPEGEYWFINTSYENWREGEYLCRDCIKKLEDKAEADRKFWDNMSDEDLKRILNY